ncbi:MAG: peptidylprolyl isomerase [Kiritimatiellae bacterium]|nr:peptidylprolyl isomerase [Kiritimatiellia bacterium]
MKIKWYILVSLALALAGCWDNGQPEAAPESSAADKSATGEKPVRNRVVVTVNGRELHSTNLNERVEMLVKVSTIANPKMTLSDIPKLRKRLRTALPKMFVREVAFEEFVKSENIKIDEAAIEKAKKKFLSGFGGRMTYDNLRRKVGSLAAVMDDFVRIQAMEDAVRQRILEKNPPNLPPNYAAEQIKRIKAYNAEMALTNAAVYARATNAWEKLKAKENFKLVARQFSEVPREAKEGGDWGTLGLQQLEPDEDLVKWVQKLRPGQFSPPIEGDNGLMILKVNSKKGDDYALSRIYFRLPMFQELVDEETLVKRKRQQHEQAVLAREISAIVKAADVVKPKTKKKAHNKKNKAKKKGDKAVDSGKKLRSKEAAKKNGTANKSAEVKKPKVAAPKKVSAPKVDKPKAAVPKADKPNTKADLKGKVKKTDSTKTK